MRRLRWTAIVLLLTSACLLHDRAAAVPQTHTNSTWEEAQGMASSAGRFVVLVPESVRCASCDAFAAELLADAATLKWLSKHAVFVRFDTDSDEPLARRLGIQPRPEFVVFAEDRVVLRSESTAGLSPQLSALPPLKGDTETAEDVKARRRIAWELAVAHRYEAATVEYMYVWHAIGRHEMHDNRNTFVLNEMASIVEAYPPAMVAFETLPGIKMARLRRMLRTGLHL